MNNKLLTKLELKVMNILWDAQAAFVKELIEKWEEEPKPAYNTVSTMVRILEEKGFVGHESQGRSHRYFPTVSREDYQKSLLQNVVDNVFSGSLSSLVSTIVDDSKVSEDELAELKKLIEDRMDS